LLDLNVPLPTFKAVDISTLPPTGTEHVDVSALLQELTLLRSEVRGMASLREEVKEMRQMLLASTSQKSSRAVDHVTTAAKTNHEDGAAPAVGCTHTESVIDCDNQLVPSAAQRLQAAIKSGASVKTARAPRKLLLSESRQTTRRSSQLTRLE